MFDAGSKNLEIMFKIATISFGCLFFSDSLSAQTVDYAIHVTAYAGTEGRHVYITRDPVGAQETWYIVRDCSMNPNLSVYISLVPIAREQYVFITDVSATADKVVCITNTEQLEENTLRALGLMD